VKYIGPPVFLFRCWFHMSILRMRLSAHDACIRQLSSHVVFARQRRASMRADMFFSKNIVQKTPKHRVSLCVLGKVTPYLKVVDAGFDNTVYCRFLLCSRRSTGCERALTCVSSHGHAHVVRKVVVCPFFAILALVSC
jgi:hypothetical protein